MPDPGIEPLFDSRRGRPRHPVNGRYVVADVEPVEPPLICDCLTPAPVHLAMWDVYECACCRRKVCL